MPSIERNIFLSENGYESIAAVERKIFLSTARSGAEEAACGIKRAEMYPAAATPMMPADTLRLP